MQAIPEKVSTGLPRLKNMTRPNKNHKRAGIHTLGLGIESLESRRVESGFDTSDDAPWLSVKDQDLSKNGVYRFDVFLSHNSSQKDWTRDLARRLHADGFKVWFDEWELRKHAGSNWIDLLASGIEQSRKIVLVWSPQFFANDWPIFEANVIQHLDPVGRQGRIVPLLHTDCDIPTKWGFRERLTFVGCSHGSGEFEFAYQWLVHNLDPKRFVIPDPQRFSPEKIRFAHRVRLVGKLWRMSAFFCSLVAVGALAAAVRDTGSFTKFWDTEFFLLWLEMAAVAGVIARGLEKLRPWGRRAGLLMTIFMCLWYPLSWYTLWLLFPAEAKKLYAKIVDDVR